MDFIGKCPACGTIISDWLNDYQDMRRMQQRFMEADHKWRDLELQLRDLRAFIVTEMCNSLFIGEKEKLQRVLNKMDDIAKRRSEPAPGACSACGKVHVGPCPFI